MKRSLVLSVVCSILYFILVACGPTEGLTPTNSDEATTGSLPASVHEVVIWNDQYTEGKDIAKWLNSLVGSVYKEREIARIITFSTYAAPNHATRDILALVELRNK